MARIKLIIEYDGSNYHGFQLQNNAITIQEELETAIKKLVGKASRITSSGRTDTGVHALGQVVTFDIDSSIPADKWKFALNSVLPPDIKVLTSEEVSADFHPRFDALSKIYKYRIYRSAVGQTLVRNYALCINEPLNIQAMQEACSYLIGVQNFKSFCASGSAVKNYERHVMNSYIEANGDYLDFYIEANGFLYNMIRIIMGLLIEVGKNQIPPVKVKEIIQAQDRTQAATTAPPQGLYLLKVNYSCHGDGGFDTLLR